LVINKPEASRVPGGIFKMPKDEKGREIPSRFYIEDGDLIFNKAAPVTDEEKAEAEAMWEIMTRGNYSPKREMRKSKDSGREDK
jgi:hypothetical protein